MKTADPITPTLKDTNLTNKSKFGEYEATINAKNGTNQLDKKIKIVVLPNSDTLPDKEPYIYAEDVVLDKVKPGNEKYDVSMHNVFAYDKQDGDLTSKVTNVGSDKVDQTIGNVYPVDFEVQDKDGNSAINNTTVTINMAPIKISTKFNAMNLDGKMQLDLSNYISESRFSYKLIVREGNKVGEGNKVSEQAITASGLKEYSFRGDELKIEQGKSYNIGVYEIGPGREYLVDGFEYNAPKIDAGPDGVVYSTGDKDGDGKDDTSSDNISYINNIYELESIGYEEKPQPGRIEFVENSATENENDLTITKYQRSYRPFSGNYRLGSNIDASASKNDTLPDSKGGFGTDGFKPIGYKFKSTPAQGGKGFDSEYSDSFTGTLDGDNHTLSNVYINRGKETKTTQIGIFGKVGKPRDMATVKSEGPNIFDLKVSNASILTPQYSDVAILVGVNDGYIKNVEVTGSVKGLNYVSGIVGQNGENRLDAVGLIENAVYKGVIESTFVTNGDANVSGAGGIAGFNRSGSEIKYSSSHGSIIGDDNIGGIAGRGEGIIKNSFSTMDIEIGSNSGGGIIGYANSLQSLTSNTYFDGNLLYPNDGGMGAYIGGIVGWDDGKIDHSFTHAVVSGRDRLGGISGADGALKVDRTLAINTQILDYDWISLTGYTTEGAYLLDNYFTPLAKIYYYYGATNQGEVVGDADPSDAKQVLNKDLENKSWWINNGYDETNWDLSGVSSGNLPKLKDGDGKVLPYQRDISIYEVPKI